MPVNNAISAYVSGRVQGVGFRYFTKSKALELNLKGWVRNLPDGRVEVAAKGDPDTLERFMQSLGTGPLGSRVERLDFQWYSEPGEFRG